MHPPNDDLPRYPDGGAATPGECGMTTQTRRIPNFAAKLRSALDATALPDGVETYVDTYGNDPCVHLTFEYKPRHYAKARFQTDAHNKDHLIPAAVIAGCHRDAERWSKDPRYTEDARRTTGDLASLLGAWLAGSSDD